MTPSEFSSFNGETSVPPMDLSQDELLAGLPLNENNRPMLGGIPLLAKLGRGGMGAVYFGVHPRLNTEVAVKVLPFHVADRNPSLIKYFFGEAQLAARVKSQNVVNVLDVNEESGIYYIVMEYVNGMSAADVLRRLKDRLDVPPIRTPALDAFPDGTPQPVGMPVHAALEICIGATEGLAAAHAMDVIHRDVKPDNIIIPRRIGGGVNAPLDLIKSKLADLGLAKPEESVAAKGLPQVSMGTPGFMAPEQVRDATQAAKPSDVFSMGATLYMLLSGRRPFSGSGIGEILMNTVSEPHEPLEEYVSDVSGTTLKVIDTCLAKNPNDRYPNGEALLEALYEAYQSLPAHLRSLSVMRQTGKITPKPFFIRNASDSPDSSGRNPGTLPTIEIDHYLEEGATATLEAKVQGTEVLKRLSDEYSRMEKAARAGGSPTAKAEPAPGKTTRRGVPVAIVAGLLIAGVLGWWFGVGAPARARHTAYINAMNEAGIVSAKARADSRPDAARKKWRRAIDAYQLAQRAAPGDPNAEAGENDALAAIKKIGTYNAMIRDAKKKERLAMAESTPADALLYWQDALAAYQKAARLSPEFDTAPSRADVVRNTIRKISNYQLTMDEAIKREQAAAGESDPASARAYQTQAAKRYATALKLFPGDRAAMTGVTRTRDALHRLDTFAERIRAAESNVADADTMPLEKQEKKLRAARTDVDAALAIRPNDALARRRRDAINTRLAHLEKRREAIDAAAAADNMFSTVLSHPNDTLKAYACAKKCLDIAMALFPDDPSLTARRDVIRKRLDTINAFVMAYNAATSAERAATSRPDAFTAMKQWQTAADEYQSALEKLPGHTGAAAGRQRAEKHVRELKKRNAVYRTLMNKAQDAEVKSIRAEKLAERQTQLKIAADAYASALDYLHDDTEASDGLRRVRKNLARIEDTLTALEDAMRLGHKARSDADQAGEDTPAGRDHLREAVRHFNDALAIDPDNADARRALTGASELLAAAPAINASAHDSGRMDSDAVIMNSAGNEKRNKNNDSVTANNTEANSSELPDDNSDNALTGSGIAITKPHVDVFGGATAFSPRTRFPMFGLNIGYMAPFAGKTLSYRPAPMIGLLYRRPFSATRFGFEIGVNYASSFEADTGDASIDIATAHGAAVAYLTRSRSIYGMIGGAVISERVRDDLFNRTTRDTGGMAEIGLGISLFRNHVDIRAKYAAIPGGGDIPGMMTIGMNYMF